ncbi:MAG: hypothetical protein RBR02_06360 [Desulfuromonadaceae bacterium]|nr:hypothetical protein [Desulfuromonadaceae bacterium]
MKNSFSFDQFLEGTYTRAIPVVTPTADINAGELIYMNSGDPTVLATETSAGVTKYLVAEAFDHDNDTEIIVYDLNGQHRLIGACDDDCVAGGRYEVDSSAITDGTTAPQVEIITIKDNGLAVFKILDSTITIVEAEA